MWTNSSTTPQFSTPPRPHHTTRKCTPGKTRTRWSSHRHRFNPIKTNRYDTQNTTQDKLNKADIIQPTPKRTCKHSLSTCTYCKHDAPHPSPVHSDWSSEDWDGNKAKARQQESLIDFTPSNPKTVTPVMDSNFCQQEAEIATKLQNVTLRQEEVRPEIIDTLVLPPEETTDRREMEADSGTTTYGTRLTEQELLLQKEEEQYAIYIATYGDIDTDMETDTDTEGIFWLRKKEDWTPHPKTEEYKTLFI